MTPTQPPALHDDLRARLSWLLRDSEATENAETEMDATFVPISLDGFRDTITQAIAALSALPEAGEAVAWQYRPKGSDEPWCDGEGALAADYSRTTWEVRHLYTTPPAAVSQPAAMVEGLRRAHDALSMASLYVDVEGSDYENDQIKESIDELAALLSAGAVQGGANADQ